MGRSRSLGIFALVALSLTSCGGPPEASGSSQPSITQSPVSEQDVCREWNDLALTASGSDLGGDALRAKVRDQIRGIAAKAEGSLKAAMNDMAELSWDDSQNVPKTTAAKATINGACGTDEFVAGAAPSQPTLAPAPTVTAPIADPGVVAKTTVINATIKGGYKAAFTLKWHELKSLTPADFAAHPNCFNSPPKFEPGWDNRQAIQGFVVTVTADFPPTNGFEWPQNENMVAQPSSTFLKSCGTSGTTLPNDSSAYPVSPASPKFSYLMYQVADKTPDNPTGTFRAITDVDNATVLLDGGHSAYCTDHSGASISCADTYR